MDNEIKIFYDYECTQEVSGPIVFSPVEAGKITNTKLLKMLDYILEDD